MSLLHSRKTFLEEKNVPYLELKVDHNPNLREEMIERSRRTSVPQIFIGDHHVGGFDDMMIMEMNDELDPLLYPE